MIQTVVVILFVLADVVLIQMNLGQLGAQTTLTVPGLPPVAVTVLAIMAAAGGALVVAWVAGQVDRAVFERQMRRRDTTRHVMGEELARVMGEEWVRMRATADDRESRSWVECVRGWTSSTATSRGCASASTGWPEMTKTAVSGRCR